MKVYYSIICHCEECNDEAIYTLNYGSPHFVRDDKSLSLRGVYDEAIYKESGLPRLFAKPRSDENLSLRGVYDEAIHKETRSPHFVRDDGHCECNEAIHKEV